MRYFAVSGYSLHGFFHSFLGASILALLLIAVIYPFRSRLEKILSALRLSQAYSFKKILLASFLGVYLHVFLDSFLYSEMEPFYPFPSNPLFGLFSAYDSHIIVYGFCSITFLLGLIMYFYIIAKKG